VGFFNFKRIVNFLSEKISMVGFVFYLFGVLVTLAMCGMAAWSDFRGFRIPNIVSLVILGAFVVAYGVLFLTGQNDVMFLSMTSHLSAAAIVLALSGFLFALKQLGAGDSKFATVIALWVGLPGLVPFLFYMAMSGGVVAALSLVLKKWKPVKNPPEGSWIAKAQEGHPSVPYGIALAIGALAAFLFQGYLSPEKWSEMF